jgi:hypothetical protein
MRRFPSIAVAVLAAAVLSGCGVFYAQVDEPELCKTVLADFPAAPPTGTSSQRVSMNFDLHSDLQSFNHGGTSSNVQLRYVEFDAAQGVSDLGFIDQATIKIQPNGQAACNLPDLVDYSKDPAVAPQATVSFTESQPIELMPCLSAGSIVLESDFSGPLPTSAWSMNVKACFSGKARINYLQ